ncbi:MAG: intradiol ring-cleavage dioxygenase [Lewinellaceae bacterium]|nr:intradiol ring-cleavage dioxygenase [Lewinellaceae bacterium]
MHLSTCFASALITTCLFLVACNSQPSSNARETLTSQPVVGGGCDGCELMYAGMPAQLHAVDTSAGWHETGQKLLITGTVYQLNGRTPAPGVILYYWQTDNQGLYSPGQGMDEEARRHGHIRGWVKTDQQGKYTIYTVRPAPYPNAADPAHIHLAVKEPNIINEYYIDEFVFDDDPLLTTPRRKAMENRGGSGILRVLISSDRQIAEHNITLGLNIPHYPASPHQDGQSSGLSIGEDCPSFAPYHAWGPDKGSRACPVCKYGRYQGILYFVGNYPDWPEIKEWLSFLEEESIARGKFLKVYFVYGNEKNYSPNRRQNELETIGRELGLKCLALTYIPALSDRKSEVYLTKINPDQANTFIIYSNISIVEKLISIQPTPENFQRIRSILEQTQSNYLDLSRPWDP